MKVRYRPSPAHVVTVLLGVTAMVVTLILTREVPPMEIAVAARPIEAGTQIGPEDLQAASAVIEGIDPAGFLTYRDALERIDTSIMVRAVREGEPLLASDLNQVGEGSGRVVSLPIGRERALSGTLRFGDVIDIIRADESGQSEVIASGLRVISASDPGTLDGYALTLSVPDGDVLSLVSAAEQGEIYAVRSGGSEPLTQTVVNPASSTP